MPALRGRTATLGLLALAFAALSAAVAGGALRGADRQGAATFDAIWRPPLAPYFGGVAVLGGIEVTTLLALGLAAYLVWRRLRAQAWAVLAFPVAIVFGAVYKGVVHHPGPPAALAHSDGPSLSSLLAHTGLLENSFPSGHVTRAVVVYGLLAFTVWRLSPRPWLRRTALIAGALVVAAVSFDRLYLEVHWESDVIGGLLLGGVCLLGAIIWVEVPRPGGA
ncbi:MAG: phosphatase PAP2 family protein [Candidatus Dormibacteraceae bacterium]